MSNIVCLARTYFRFSVVITLFILLTLACNSIICASLSVVLEIVAFLKITACLAQRYFVDGREMMIFLMLITSCIPRVLF